MNFNHETLYLGRIRNYVWHRDTGNLVVVVIDDQCGLALANLEDVAILDETILPILREHACSWEDTRAIGFFRLMARETHAEEVLEFIQEWLNKINRGADTRVCFLVDALYGEEGVSTGARCTINTLTNTYSYPKHNIAYLTKGTIAALAELPSGYAIFLKGNEADWAQRHDELSPELMSFFGFGG